jgi:hypothetical protein
MQFATKNIGVELLFNLTSEFFLVKHERYLVQVIVHNREYTIDLEF